MHPDRLKRVVKDRFWLFRKQAGSKQFMKVQSAAIEATDARAALQQFLSGGTGREGEYLVKNGSIIEHFTVTVPTQYTIE